jgi:ribosomal protein S18 acetylase RimI-like enzyme
VSHHDDVDFTVDGLSFRPAVETDYSHLWQLYRAAMYESVAATWPWDETWQEARFRMHWHPERVTVIERDNQCLGMVVLDEGPDGIQVTNFTIAPAHQSQGIGTAIMSAILASARTRAVPVVLTVLKANRACRFYERLGFEVVGETATHFAMSVEPKAT